MRYIKRSFRIIVSLLFLLLQSTIFRSFYVCIFYNDLEICWAPYSIFVSKHTCVAIYSRPFLAEWGLSFKFPCNFILFNIYHLSLVYIQISFKHLQKRVSNSSAARHCPLFCLVYNIHSQNFI